MVEPTEATVHLRPTVVLGLVYASTSASWAAWALLAVILPFRFESLGLSVVQYGVAIAALALGMLLTESVWGALAFRIGKVRTIVALGAVVVVVYASIGFSTTFLALTVSLGLLGALYIFQVPLLRWMALTALGPGTSGRGTGIYGLSSGLGLVVGTTLGPLIYEGFGFSTLTVVVITVYVGSVAITVVLPWRRVHLPAQVPGFTRHLRSVFNRTFALAATLVVLAYLAKPLVWNFLQYYSVARFHGTPSEAGYVIGAAQGTSYLVGALLGILVDRFGPGRSVPFGFVLVTLGAIGTLISSTYAEMVGATLVFAIGLGWLSASLLPLALGEVARPLQGTAIGVFGSFEDLGLLMGPLLISVVYATYGVTSIFLVVGAVALSGLVLSLSYRPSRSDARLESSSSGGWGD